MNLEMFSPILIGFGIYAFVIVWWFSKREKSFREALEKLHPGQLKEALKARNAIKEKEEKL